MYRIYCELNAINTEVQVMLSYNITFMDIFQEQVFHERGNFNVFMFWPQKSLPLYSNFQSNHKPVKKIRSCYPKEVKQDGDRVRISDNHLPTEVPFKQLSVHQMTFTRATENR